MTIVNFTPWVGLLAGMWGYRVIMVAPGSR